MKSVETTKTNQTDQQIGIEIVNLLRSEGYELKKGISHACLFGVRMLHEYAEREAKKAQKACKEQNRRDGLEGQEQINYLLNKLQESLQVYSPVHQDTFILPLALKEQDVPENWQSTRDHATYIKGSMEKIFGGLDESIRQQVVAKYRTEVLPGLLDEWEEGQEEQDALDEFVALTDGKTVEEVRAMTRLLKDQKAVA